MVVSTPVAWQLLIFLDELGPASIIQKVWRLVVINELDVQLLCKASKVLKVLDSKRADTVSAVENQLILVAFLLFSALHRVGSDRDERQEGLLKVLPVKSEVHRLRQVLRH